jgi:hypothetical protein
MTFIEDIFLFHKRKRLNDLSSHPFKMMKLGLIIKVLAFCGSAPKIFGLWASAPKISGQLQLFIPALIVM